MTDPKHNPARRRLLLNAAAGTAAGALTTRAAAAAPSRKCDLEADIVCVGSGAAGLTAAVVAAALGNGVLVLEKGPITGGTTRKSGGVFWIANHPWLRQKGIDDRKSECIQYLCRMAYSERHRADSPTLGLDPPAYASLETFYDNGYKMVDRLRELGALRIAPFEMWQMKRPEPDYQDHLPEDKVSKGRSLGVKKSDGSDGAGADYIDQLVEHLQGCGVEVLTDHRVVNLIRGAQHEIIGTGDDIAEAVLWLASDAARYVSGSLLTVDGAFLAA